MHTLLERLRAALAPDYQVERELGQGGMGHVFLARDVRLDKPVAIKVIRPELATEEALERFEREARILARMDHPNIVAVYRAGEAAGLFYYVMAYLSGEPLSVRLERGPAPLDEVVRLASDILHALEAAHSRDIIHRDLKPSNIFAEGARNVVIDFGLAKTPELPSSATTAVGVGTPAYMPPEQNTGGRISHRTDLYAAGAVIYEALTGYQWNVNVAEDAVWASVPPAVVPVLKRALAWSPEERWSDARAFREAFIAAATGTGWRRVHYRSAATVLGIGAAFILIRAIVPDPPPPPLPTRPLPSYTLAILPLEHAGTADTLLGQHIALVAALNLYAVPEFAVPAHQVFRHLDERDGDDAVSQDAHHDLHTDYILVGFVSIQGPEAVVQATLERRRGEQKVDIYFRGAPDSHALGDSLTLHVLRKLRPDLARLSSRLAGRSSDAVRPFLLGNLAFMRDDWATAEAHFLAAVERDSTFGLAWWQLAVTQKWLPGRPRLDLSRLTETDTISLLPADRDLISADAIPLGLVARLRAFESVRQQHVDDPLAALLHADELFHRGALFGIGLDSAATALLDAAARYNRFSPPLEHAAWALIRLGDEAKAEDAIARLNAAAGPAATSNPGGQPALMRIAFELRFGAERADAAHTLLQLLPELPDTMRVFVARVGLSVGLPETQRALGDAVFRARGTPARVRGSGAMAQALAWLAMGRARHAVAALDSAAALLGSEAELQAAQWRLIPGVVGWDVMPASEVTNGRARLKGGWGDAQRPRAHWTLAMDALARGDAAGAARWKDSLRVARRQRHMSDSELSDDDTYVTLIEAGEAALRLDYREALRLSDSLQEYAVQRGGRDPFLRAVLYLERGFWYEKIGDLQAADREWLWSENNDIAGWLHAAAEAAEIDWVFAAYSAYLRSIAGVGGEREAAARACLHVARVEHFWRNAEPTSAALLRYARRKAAPCSA